MAKRWLGLVVIALLSLPAHAGDAKAPKGFWKILVKPSAKWVLKNTTKNDGSTLTIETYDVRKIDGADVARLRWTHRWGKGKADQDAEAASGGTQTPTQVAVTDKGVYLLNASMDDAAVSKALKGKPSRSDPPKSYKGTKVNKGRYLRVDGDTVCMGEEPLEDAGDCADICEGEICISATQGVISLHGTLSPNHDDFSQSGK
jgi:hypothetical protein